MAERDIQNKVLLPAILILRSSALLLIGCFCVSCSLLNQLSNQEESQLLEASLRQHDQPKKTQLLQTVRPWKDQLHIFAPAFLLNDANKNYNRIGIPQARRNKQGALQISVNPAIPVLFAQSKNFRTARGEYHNLIYRIHFTKTPFALPDELHFTTGDNVGLLIVLTLNENNTIVLVTAVHTCGRYLSFFPTDALPADARPKDWPPYFQTVYGKQLPAWIRTPDPERGDRMEICLEGGSHRVVDIRTVADFEVAASSPKNDMTILPMDSLSHLALGNETVSFFETTGPHRGYVHGSSKPLERLLISWWALDWHVGEDKALGDRNETGTIFYTSLKFWDRDRSNMWNFPEFLKFWGWNL